MFFTSRRGTSRSWSALFVPAPQPGLVIRTIERGVRPPSPFSRPRVPVATKAIDLLPQLPLLLSSPPAPGPIPWRVLWAQSDDLEESAAHLNRVGPLLSQVVSPYVVFLSATPSENTWAFVVWENGGEIERGGNSDITQSANQAASSGVFAAMLRRASPSVPLSAQAWAKARDLSLSTLRQKVESPQSARIVDYDAVAGLERKGLLVETAPVWYRFAAADADSESDSQSSGKPAV